MAKTSTNRKRERHVTPSPKYLRRDATTGRYMRPKDGVVHTRVVEVAKGREIPPVATDEAQWDKVFARSHEKHQKLAAKIREDIKAGRTRPLDLEQL